MRKLLLVCWLTIPVAAYAYHKGPGQRQLQLDDVSRILARADQHASTAEWAQAEADYEAALTRLPADQVVEARRIRLEKAKAQMFIKKLPIAHQDLKSLVDELQADPRTDPKFMAEARAALANSQYYMTWLMRLEGQPRDKWEPEIESSRQIFRLLAEQAEERGDSKAASRNREDLESSVRLARMDLSDLQGLPLPSQ